MSLQENIFSGIACPHIFNGFDDITAVTEFQLIFQAITQYWFVKWHVSIQEPKGKWHIKASAMALSLPFVSSPSSAWILIWAYWHFILINYHKIPDKPSPGTHAWSSRGHCNIHTCNSHQCVTSRCFIVILLMTVLARFQTSLIYVSKLQSDLTAKWAMLDIHTWNSEVWKAKQYTGN